MIELGVSQFDGPVYLRLDKANRHGIVSGATGTGKCWGKGTGIILFDGTIRKVEDIAAGDMLMGPDSKPRTVLSTTKGTGPLFQVKPIKGEPWVCNDVHILSLRCTANGMGHKKNEIVNVQLDEWLGWSKSLKHMFKLWRTPISFASAPSKADPYMAGLYFADGASVHANFNHAIKDTYKLDEIREHFGKNVRVSESRGSRQVSISRTSDFWQAVSPYIKDSRTVPTWIKHNSDEVRLQFLAGVVDGDGNKSGNGFGISTKHKSFADDLTFIARSLGFAASLSTSQKGIKSTGFSGEYCRVFISGDTDLIPVRCDRKRCTDRLQKKNVLNTGFSVEPIGDGEYFGFELDGDRLCLLWDFTVTHNTVTLQHLAEEFSRSGVPVFAADIKGDLSGIAALGNPESKPAARVRELGRTFTPERFPVRFLDVFGQAGTKIMTSVQEMGELMLSRMLRLNDAQSGALSIAFKKSADDADWMLTLDDLRWTLDSMLENREDVCRRYGNISASMVNAIQRNLMALEAQGGHHLFGEPGFDLNSLMQTEKGKGIVTLLHADSLMEAPRVYGMLLLWMLTGLFRTLPECGDLDKPKMVFLFDESHLLFRDAPAALLEQIERVVRLIRSKGVSVWFISQAVSDIPDTVLAQLGNRVQHRINAYTPSDQRAVKATVKAFRPRKGLDVAGTLTEMGVGEALVSVLDEFGTPTEVQRVRIVPPCAQVGPLSAVEREAMLAPQRAAQHAIEPAMQNMAFVNRMRAANGYAQIEAGVAHDGEEIWRKHVPTFTGVEDAGGLGKRLFGLVCAIVVGGLVFAAMV